jgi:hypothetical protein
MDNNKKLKVLAAGFVVLLLLNSCADFFSTSWGDAFKRDPKKVKVTVSNVGQLLEVAKGDPELSRAILDKIDANSAGALKQAAIKAANQAAGVTTLVLENVKTLIDAYNDRDSIGNYEDAITGVVETIQGAAEKNDVRGISEKLVEILGNEISPKNALIETSKSSPIEFSVPPKNGVGQPAKVAIVVDDKGEGTVTVTVNNAPTSYPCVVNDDGTITLTQNNGAPDSVIGCVFTVSDDGSLAPVLTGLGEIKEIAEAGFADKSEPCDTPIAYGKPEFAGDFLNAGVPVPDSDLTLAVMALILAKAEKERGPDGKLEDYFKSWENKDVVTGANLDGEELLIAAIVNGMIDRGEISGDKNELLEMLKDLLRQNGQPI